MTANDVGTLRPWSCEECVVVCGCAWENGNEMDVCDLCVSSTGCQHDQKRIGGKGGVISVPILVLSN